MRRLRGGGNTDRQRALCRSMLVANPSRPTLVVPIATTTEVKFEAEAEMERTGSVRHRAESDARRLYDTWRRLKVLAADAMDGLPA
jgi:hypothetical protein